MAPNLNIGNGKSSKDSNSKLATRWKKSAFRHGKIGK
jgi:hypothetical protein